MPVLGLLASVPLDHLLDGLEVCQEQGKVAFGTRAWEAFRDWRRRRDLGLRC